MAQILTVLSQLIKLVVQTHLQLSVICNFLSNLRVKEGREVSLDLVRGFFLRTETCMVLQLIIIVIHELDLHVLNVLSGKPILSVEELYHLFLRCAYCPIVLNHHILQGLN